MVKVNFTILMDLATVVYLGMTSRTDRVVSLIIMGHNIRVTLLMTNLKVKVF